ncbi:MAG TPA: FimV/HubP family polar landmark protein, partial [Methylophilaceae bacterium]|nr:FimV/HubP family polar landmark protein [Methylophilaceae bacterium]
KPAAPAAKPKKRIVPPPPPPPEPGLLDGLMEDPTLIAAAGGGLVLLAGGWLFLRNRRRRNLDSFEQGILTAGGLKANTVFGNTAGGTVDTGDTSFLTDFSQSGGGMIDTHDVDPIAEAEVYMAYGRDAQAEEILKDAIAKEPQRYELHLKLLEILANRKDTAAFETIAGELYSTLGSGNPTWAKVAEMGHQLEPGNPLYDTKGSASGAAAVVAASAVAAAAAASNLEASDFENAEELKESSLDFSMDTAAQSEQPAVTPLEETSSLMDFNMGSSANAETDKPLSEMTTMSDSIFGATQPQPEDESSSLKFTAPEVSRDEEVTAGLTDFGTTVPGLEMPEMGSSETNAAIEPTEPPQPAAVEDGGLNFEMPELKTSEAEESMEPTAPEELPSFGQTLMMDASAADNEISFEVPGAETPSLELPDLGESAEAVEEEKPAEANGLDFSFDSMLEASEEVSFESEEEETPNPPEIDLSGISLDFGPTIDNPEAHQEEITISSGAEAATGAGESAEVETKLDLVTAYMEMGDKEGARELLDEVMKEGGPQQKERAQQMINEMG